MPRKKKKLLADVGNDLGLGGDDEDFHINEDFARRFEHNKRREELHRLQAKHGDVAFKFGANGNDGASSSDEEEEDDGDIPEEQEAKILDTLLRIRRKDPLIYKSDVHFFKEEEGDADGAGDGQEGAAGGADGAAGEGKKRTKPLYLKDVLAKQVLEHGPELEGSDDEGEGARGRVGETRKPHAYDKEQEDLRQEFISAAKVAGEAGEDVFGGVLKKAKKSKLAGQGEAAAEPLVDKLANEVFSAEDDEGERFLKQYILKRGWIDMDDEPSKKPPLLSSQRHADVDADDEDGEAGEGEEGGDLEEDDDFLNEVDRYEAAYNFRYEEPGGARIMLHPREVEGTVRKEDDRRKRQRQSKAERQKEEESREEEEVKRLKNLKKREIEERLAEVKRVAGLKAAKGAGPKGATADVAMGNILEGDFDPEKWDRAMAQAFGDDYYEAEDDEAELLGQDAGLLSGDKEEEEEGGSGEGFRALYRKLKQAKGGDGEDGAGGDEEKEEEEGEEDEAGQGAADAAAQRASLQQLLSDYYKLDYEDNVGGIKTRFRYKEVPSNAYGMSVEDILMMDDKDLNQVVGLKRLAPYREDIGKDRPNYKALQSLKAAGGPLEQTVRRRRQQLRQPGSQGQHPDKGAAKAWSQMGGKTWSNNGTQQGGERGGSKGKDRVWAKDGKPSQGKSNVRSSGAPGGGSGAHAAGDGHPGGTQRKSKGREDGRGSSQVEARKSAASETADGGLGASRLASYGKLTLRKEGGGGGKEGGGADGKGDGGGGKKRKHEERRTDVDGSGKRAKGDQAGTGALPSSAPASTYPEGLSKAAKKNFKRSSKRAAKMTTAAAGDA